MWNCIFGSFSQFKNWFLAIFEIAKKNFVKNFFVKLIYLISGVFLVWTFFNFLAHCGFYLQRVFFLLHFFVKDSRMHPISRNSNILSFFSNIEITNEVVVFFQHTHTMYDFHNSTDTLKFWTEKHDINKNLLFFIKIRWKTKKFYLE